MESCNFNKMKDMETHKVLGIWMNYSSAFLTDLTNDSRAARGILPDSISPENENKKVCENNIISKDFGENQSEYFQKVSDVMDGYQEVLIFGDSGAKREFSEILALNYLFKSKKIEFRDSYKITESQLMAFYEA